MCFVYHVGIENFRKIKQLAQGLDQVKIGKRKRRKLGPTLLKSWPKLKAQSMSHHPFSIFPLSLSLSLSPLCLSVSD